MKPASVWKWSLLLALLSLPFAAYWLADAWLESSGGRQMLEQELTRRLGMSVRLEGEFDLMLLPDIGVSGTELVIGGEADSTPVKGSSPPPFFARSRAFEVSVALKPLFKKQVVVEWIRLTDGMVYPDHYAHNASGSGGETAVADAVLPEIQELTLRDFTVVLDEETGAAVRLKLLEISDFADGRRAPFGLEFEDLLAVDGWLLWETARSKIELGDLRLDLGGQDLSGEACLLLREPLSLNVELKAQTFDVDAFMDNLPELGTGGGDAPMEIRARFSVDEFRSSGVVARGVVLNLGPDPVCD